MKYPHLERQPKPRESQNSQIVLDRVIDDLLEKARLGELEYKTKLKTFNGRKALIDAYQEQLDQLMYFKQYLMELDEIANEENCIK